MTSHEDVEQRRETVYALYLRGATLTEIAAIMDIPRSVAHYDITQTRSKNNNWAVEKLGTPGKVLAFYKEMWDRHLHAYREAWRMYEVTPDTDARLKALLLNQAMQCLDRVRALFARMAPEASELDWPEPEPEEAVGESLETTPTPEEKNSMAVEQESNLTSKLQVI